MKDVPVQLAKGIVQAAVLKRANHQDIFVPHPDLYTRKIMRNKVFVSTSVTYSIGKSGLEKHTESPTKIGLNLPLRENPDKPGELEDIIIATSSVRRIAQWLNRYPNSKIENLRGNVNTRLRKLNESNWHGAIFAAACGPGGEHMVSLMKFGRKLKLPSTIQIKHQLLVRWLADQMAKEAAEAATLALCPAPQVETPTVKRP